MQQVWGSMIKALVRDKRTWCLGNIGAQRCSTVHDVLCNKHVCTGEATRLEIGIGKSKQDKATLLKGHPLRALFDGQSHADDQAELAHLIAVHEACKVDLSLDPETIVFAISPPAGASPARTHRDSYFNFSLQVQKPLCVRTSSCCKSFAQFSLTLGLCGWAGGRQEDLVASTP